ncbi:MAG: hypothetical protein IIA72_20115 [Proteobacteria bacterium]|nr:hypothetical protein [Pseudomonadota bacterium]
MRDERVTFVREGATTGHSHRTDTVQESHTRAAESNSISRSSAPSSIDSATPRDELPVIALVACAKTKSAQPDKAKDLYASPLFRKSRAYVERHEWHWYILSALHGLVDPETVLEPYERSLLGAGRAARQEWASNVVRALEAILPYRARIVLLAGKSYYEFLVPGLEARGHVVEQPLEGLSLGRRLAFLGSFATGEGGNSIKQANSARGRSGAQARLPDELGPLSREHYEVARTFEGFFDRAAFLARYREHYSQRGSGSIIPSDYCFNRDNKGNPFHPRFLWWDGQHSYVFVGLHGAPKGFARTTRQPEAPSDSPDAIFDRGRKVGLDKDVPDNHLHVDMERARALAVRLHSVFLPSGKGIFGEHQMPEDILPVGLTIGSREHLLFLMLTVSVDYMRNASALWKAGCEAWADASLRYLYEPQNVVAAGYQKVEHDLKLCGISRKTRRDADAWFTISRTLAEKWKGDPRRFLGDCGNDAPTILRRLTRDNHLEDDRRRPDFPLLRGPKIGPLWVRMLRDNAGITLSALAEVPIPVDVHILRATLCTGVLHGDFAGSTNEIFERVRRAWRDATHGLSLTDEQPMVSMDVDAALWTLSRLGCSKRGNGELGPCRHDCPAAPGCITGTVRIQNDRCEVRTTAAR